MLSVVTKKHTYNLQLSMQCIPVQYYYISLLTIIIYLFILTVFMKEEEPCLSLQAAADSWTACLS